MCMKVGIIINSSSIWERGIRKVPPVGGTFRLIGGGWEGLSLFFGGSKLRLGTEAQMECVVSEYRYSA